MKGLKKYLKQLQLKTNPVPTHHTHSDITTQLLILVVDDAKVNRYILKKYIEKARPQTVVHEASNGYIAIDLCLENNYDYVFMDIKMPGIDGIETTKEILKTKPNTIVWGTTGQVEAKMLAEATKAGIKGCIGKPISLIDINNMLNL
jgi:CheY-like chemotaxis protein